MQIKLTSPLVDDQDKALAFCGDKLGFAKLHDIRMGSFRWLTMTSPEGVDGVEFEDGCGNLINLVQPT